MHYNIQRIIEGNEKKHQTNPPEHAQRKVETVYDRIVIFLQGKERKTTAEFLFYPIMTSFPKMEDTKQSFRNLHKLYSGEIKKTVQRNFLINSRKKDNF